MTYFLSPIVGVAATSPTRRTRPFCRYRDISPVSAGESTPKEEARFVFASIAKQSPGRVKVYGCIYSSLKSWDISLTLNMTHLFYVILNAAKNPTEELTGIYSSLKSWDISLTLNMTHLFFTLRFLFQPQNTR